MSLLLADLPSEDEADDDYDPSNDAKTDETVQAKTSHTGAKRRRGSAAYPQASGIDDDESDHSEQRLESSTPASLAKKAKVDQLWAQLNKGKAMAKPAQVAITEVPKAETMPAQQEAAAKQPLSLAAICRPVTKKQKIASDVVRPRPSPGLSVARANRTAVSHLCFVTGLDASAGHQVIKGTRYRRGATLGSFLLIASPRWPIHAMACAEMHSYAVAGQ